MRRASAASSGSGALITYQGNGRQFSRTCRLAMIDDMALLEHSPRFATEDAVRLASERFQLAVEAAPLPSERDQNFRLTTPDGQRFVLKIANSLEERSLLEAENAAMEHLHAGKARYRIVLENDFA